MMAVRLDYSEAYRSNERLDAVLDHRLVTLTRSAERVISETEDELEAARCEADNILRLKEAAKRQQENNHDGGGVVSFVDGIAIGHADTNGSGLVCDALNRPRSAMLRRGKSFPATDKPKSAGAKRASVSVAKRRASAMSSISAGTAAGEDEEEDINDVLGLSAELAEAAKKMSLTERRLAMERDQFSSKNLFNVIRKNSTMHYYSSQDVTDGGRSDASPDRQRRGTSTMTGTHNGLRPMTAPAGNRASHRRVNGKHRRPATSTPTSRLSRFSNLADTNGAVSVDLFGRPHRRFPRSRRELEKLSRLNIDPFNDGEDKAAEAARVKEEEILANAGKDAAQQELLHQLRDHAPQLQARVASFLKGVEQFNRRDQKSGLEQILEDT